MLLEPQHGLGIQVVGGFVQQQQVRLLEQQLAQRHTTALTTGEHLHIRVRRRAPQRVHGLLELGVEIPRVGGVDLFLQLAHLFHQGVEVGVRLGHLGGDLVEAVELGLDLADALLHVAQDGLVLVQRGFLQKDAHGVAGAQARLAVGGLVQPRHDLQNRRLTCAVRPHHADLGAGEERHGDVIEDDLVAHFLAGFVHGVDKFRHTLQATAPPHPREPRSDVVPSPPGVAAPRSPGRAVPVPESLPGTTTPPAPY